MEKMEKKTKMRVRLHPEAMVKIAELAEKMHDKKKEWDNLPLSKQIDRSCSKHLRSEQLKVAGELLDMLDNREIMVFGASSCDVDCATGAHVSIKAVSRETGEEVKVLTIGPRSVSFL